MKLRPQGPRSLWELEQEVLAEGREWMRQRLEAKMQAEADLHGGVFPPQPEKSASSAKRRDASAHRRRRG